MTDRDYEKIGAMIARQIGVFAESVDHKFDILIEGHQMLAEQLARFRSDVEKRFECVEHKLDVTAAKVETMQGVLQSVEARLTRVETSLDEVAADLKAHRADTEAHPGMYGVREKD